MCAAILRGLCRLIWQPCWVHERQLDPKMMQSQPHSTSTVPSLAFSFIPLTDVSSIFVSHSHHPRCFRVHFSSLYLYLLFCSHWDIEIHAYESFLSLWIWECVGISPGLRAVVCSAGEHAAPAELKCISSVQLLSQEGKLYIGLRCSPLSKKEKQLFIYKYIYIYIYIHSISQKWVHPSHFGNQFSIYFQGTIL